MRVICEGRGQTHQKAERQPDGGLSPLLSVRRRLCTDMCGGGADHNGKGLLAEVSRPFFTCHLDRSGEIPRQARDDRGGVRE